MSEKEFCLLDMPWIRVIDFDCSISEVSLIELFKNAHLYKGLAGELPTQDFAVMRLLLAVLHTVFSRYAPNGESSPLTDPDDALDRWKELWKSKKFPERVITDYLETQRESFWLFHPERPFYQVAEVDKLGEVSNSKYDAKKFIGSLSESKHKKRLFTAVNGDEKASVSYGEAARWLLNLNGFDDNAVKDGAGIGWLGNLGLISAVGNNLFETLMFNFIIYNVNNVEAWDYEKPIWENSGKPAHKKEIPFPDNLSELYTLQSRRSFLRRSNGRVTGYQIQGGDYFDSKTAFLEPMTLWKQAQNGIDIVPKTHHPSMQFWRDFASVFPKSAEKNSRCPGIIDWLKVLSVKVFNMNYAIMLKTASIQYSGSQRSSVENIFSDTLQMHASLISDMSFAWQNKVRECVEFCDKIAGYVWSFARDVSVASGGSGADDPSVKHFSDRVKSDFYNRIDAPFRKWLCALDPETDDVLEKEKEWRRECAGIARQLGGEIVSRAKPTAIFGRKLPDKSGKKKKGASETAKLFSAAQAMNIFRSRLRTAEKS